MSAGALTPSFCEHLYTITTLTNLIFNEFPFDLVPFLKMQFGKSGHICHVHAQCSNFWLLLYTIRCIMFLSDLYVCHVLSTQLWL